MGENAQEGIFIGVYIFVFIVALSATIMMFTMINNYADLSYDYGKQIGEGALIENVPETTYRIVTGDQLISYYYDYMYRQNTRYRLVVKDKDNKTIEFREGMLYERVLKFCDPMKNYYLSYDSVDKYGNVNITIKEIENF